MQATPTARARRSFQLAVVAALLAACAVTPTAPTVGQDVHASADDPCKGKDPSAEARGEQGKAPYVGVDTYANIVVKEGTVLYSLTPGSPPRFAVVEETLRDAGGSWKKYYELVQVTTDPGADPDGKPRKLRETVRAFHVTEHLCVARGIVLANPQFGSGGGTQYYVSPSDSAKLRAADIMPITRWQPGGGR